MKYNLAKTKVIRGVFSAALLLFSGASAAATTCNLTTGIGVSCVTSDARFYESSTHGFGSGAAVDFLTFHIDGINTTDGGTTGTHNRNVQIQLETLRQASFGGESYREFAFDVGQSGVDPTLTIDKIKIFVSDQNDLIGGGEPDPDYLAGAELIFDLDKLDASTSPDYNILLSGTGSGASDMLMYVREFLFYDTLGDFGDNPWVYIYTSVIGDSGAAEGWAYVEGGTPIPVPAAFWLFGSALIGFVGFSRRRRS